MADVAKLELMTVQVSQTQGKGRLPEGERRAKLTGLVRDSGFSTIEDVAQYLNINAKTLYAKVSEIPHYKVGRLIRFKMKEIDAWMESKKSGSSTAQPTTHPRGRRPTSIKNTEAHVIVRKAIDEAKESHYTSQRGKSGRIESLGKE